MNKNKKTGRGSPSYRGELLDRRNVKEVSIKNCDGGQVRVLVVNASNKCLPVKAVLEAVSQFKSENEKGGDINFD